jgi:hypothetical protein
MAKFKCNETGNVVEFSSDYDIKSMRTNSEYTEVSEDQKKELNKAEFKKVTKE